jgi:hypothetical protein
MPRPNRSFSIIGLCFILSVQIGCKKDREQSTPPAIADGTYSIGPIRCKKSGLEPEYPDALKKALLQQFDDTESHQLKIAGPNAVEEIKSSECSLIIHREIMNNSGERFGYRDSRKSTFTPEECKLSVKFDGGILKFGSNNQIIPDRDRPDHEELAFVVEAKQDGYILTTVNSEEVNEVWEQYGCASADQLQFDLTK